jgi:hypothetical protein
VKFCVDREIFESVGGMCHDPIPYICVRLVILVVDTRCVEFSFPLGAIRPF